MNKTQKAFVDAFPTPAMAFDDIKLLDDIGTKVFSLSHSLKADELQVVGDTIHHIEKEYIQYANDNSIYPPLLNRAKLMFNNYYHYINGGIKRNSPTRFTAEDEALRNPKPIPISDALVKKIAGTHPEIPLTKVSFL